MKCQFFATGCYESLVLRTSCFGVTTKCSCIKKHVFDNGNRYADRELFAHVGKSASHPIPEDRRYFIIVNIRQRPSLHFSCMLMFEFPSKLMQIDLITCKCLLEDEVTKNNKKMVVATWTDR